MDNIPLKESIEAIAHSIGLTPPPSAFFLFVYCEDDHENVLSANVDMKRRLMDV